MTRLSVNVNKIALLRNARGGNLPDLLQVALDCESFGAQGITVHPRPDERHIRYRDVGELKQRLTTELNVEGNPTPDFLEMVLNHRPAQCTLVPDAPHALTSDAGWDTTRHRPFLTKICARLKGAGIRVSLFIDPEEIPIRGAQRCGADCVEFYTGPYAAGFETNANAAVAPYVEGALLAHSLGLRVNAGHDLNLNNLAWYASHVPHLAEVSIGHALICDALYHGLADTIRQYREKISS